MLQPLKIGIPLAHQIQQPSRSRHNHLGSKTQRPDLRTLPHPAINHGHIQRHMLRIRTQVFLNLHHQLTRGRQNQRLHSTRPLRAARFGMQHQRKYRQRESRRLASASLSNTRQVAPSQNFGNRRRLNRRRLSVTRFLNGLENAVVKTEGAKWHDLTVAEKSPLCTSYTQLNANLLEHRKEEAPVHPKTHTPTQNADPERRPRTPT